MGGYRVPFPLTYLSKRRKKGVEEARRGEGALLGRLEVEGRALGPLKGESGEAYELLSKGLELLKGLPVPEKFTVQFVEGHEWMAEGRDGRVLVDVEGAQPGLYAMGLAYIFSQWAGMEDAEALDRALKLYEDFPESVRQAVLEALRSPELDVGGALRRLLEEAPGKPREERERLISWTLARAFIELPYDASGARRAIEATSGDLEALRMALYQVLRDTYDYDLEEVHAERVARWCRENGVRLVGGRFSRAFYIDAMLMASSKALLSAKIKGPVEELRRWAGATKFRIESLGRDVSLEELGGELQEVVNLTLREEVSEAEVEGAIERFKKALREWEGKWISILDREQLHRAAQIASERKDGESPTLQSIARDRAYLRAKVEALMEAVSRVEAAAASAPKRSPAFMAFFQRIFPIDALNIGIVNELLDPFFGEDPEVHRLIRESGSRLYVTPHLKAWLRHCDDWVEALPAYATYQIVPKDGGYEVSAWVQRSILEDMYRRHAEDWALNIEEVMATEHIALAREVLAEAEGIEDRSERGLLKAFMGREKAVAAAAVLVERAYEEHPVEVARIGEERGLGRMDALRKFLRTLPEDHPVQRARNGDDPAILARQEGLDTRAEALLPLVDLPRRDLPCIHVLTTLGPGESEVYVRNWLEEAMALFAVSRAHGLEGEVARRVGEYRTRIISVGERLVKELELESELYRLLPEAGGREEALLRLLASYPEVGEEAVRLALLLDWEGRDPHDTSEPQAVLDHLKARTEIRAKALEEVAEENGVSVDEVERDPSLFAEAEAQALSKARREVLERLGLDGEVRGYLRMRLDPDMARVIARREVIAERGLSEQLHHPKFRYDATGPFKKYHLLYTPSRVDLGPEEVQSVREVPKWVGGIDRDAARSGRALYNLYNTAGPVALDSPRWAEFLKVGENFFSRGGVFYLSLTAGANLDALGIGEFEFFRDQWNRRADRIVLPGGETYGGFCVPKEFSLLYAIVIAAVRKETSERMLGAFGVPKELQGVVLEDLREILRMRLDCTSELDWELQAASFLSERYPEYFRVLGRAGYVVRLPQLADALYKAGVLFPQDEERGRGKFELAYWADKKAQGLEEVNRIGPFRKVLLIRELLEEARRRNPQVAPDHKLIGVMGAAYKEGSRKDGREIRITDVRFSAGARKLEIYAGTYEHHLLKDIDPEGKKLIRRLFKDFRSPADIRIVGTCAGSDLLNHVPGSGLEEEKERVHRRLLEAGLTEDQIDANCHVFGGDLERWAGVRELPLEERERLLADIGPRIHLLVVDRRGPFRRYEEALQGADFVDLSIPDPELLDLIDDLPKMLYIMRQGRPDSALALADGTSGARRYTFSFRYPSIKRKVKELFALEEKAVYRALGVGRETIEKWRREAISERDKAMALYKALVEERREEARRLYQEIVREVVAADKAGEAAREEQAARRLGVWRRDYRYRSEALSRVARGMPLSRMDFGTWLLLGGMYGLSGRASEEEMRGYRLCFEEAIKALPLEDGPKGFSPKEVDEIIRFWVRPRYTPPPEGIYREVETGIMGSLKAVEEQVSRLAKREARRRQARRAMALRARRDAFVDAWGKAKGAFPEAYGRAKALLGDGRATPSPEASGRFLAWTRRAFLELASSLGPVGEKIGELASSLFDGGELSIEGYRDLEALTAKSAEVVRKDSSRLEQVAQALELLDIAYLLDRTYDLSPDEMMVEIAKFFDLTVNSHFFDYPPYHYHRERGVGFEDLSRRERFQLAERRHRWLYTYIHHLMSTATELSVRPSEYLDAWLGDMDRGVVPLGVRGEAERFWFGYARLRDVAVLRYEGFPLPEVLRGVGPDDLKARERANVAIVYPHGNTTVPVALEQGPKLAGEGINLLLCAFPEVRERDGWKVLMLHDGFGRISAEDYERITGKRPEGEGVWVLMEFREPIVAHGVFFHFTHPLRPYIEEVQAPLIQPFLWEAATYLKCALPNMLRGSGVRTAEQVNFYHGDLMAVPEEEAKARIEKKLLDFSERYPTIIVKPEKESGGRKAKILPVRSDGEVLWDNLRELRDLIYDICKADNAIVQEVLESRVRQLYTQEFLEDLVDRFARIGVPVLLDREPKTPLFSYFRQVLVWNGENYEISHHITVVSTRGIANVGQGGLLYEYTDDIINPKYREDMRRGITEAAYRSMEAQRRYIREHWREILEEYLDAFPEFQGEIKIEPPGEDLTGFSYMDIPYEMGDYMPVFLVDEEDRLVRLYNPDREELVPLFDEEGRSTGVKVYDRDGRLISYEEPIPMFDSQGNRIRLYDGKGRPIPTLVLYKIEPNPGAGLWRPHNDQLPPERKGEGVYIVFKCLGERAKVYKGIMES
ncbi:MAG TPA: hypothetical protein EYP17_00720 [Candidatus Latescibacteria bacterium]|nr:hypothetical protein [Candidatus Latescibacterota bacterium]